MVCGKYNVISNDKIRVTELPVGYWTEDFKQHLDNLTANVDKNGKKITPVIKEIDDMSKTTDIDIVITFTDNDVIKSLVATGTIIYETKFIHNCGMCAHIEDICVQEAFRKHGFGSILMRHLVETAKLKGAYKIILDCSEELEGFYLKHGFHKHGLQMANYVQ